jgi:hypothetical protein
MVYGEGCTGRRHGCQEIKIESKMAPMAMTKIIFARWGVICAAKNCSTPVNQFVSSEYDGDSSPATRDTRVLAAESSGVFPHFGQASIACTMVAPHFVHCIDNSSTTQLIVRISAWLYYTIFFAFFGVFRGD